MKEDKMLPLRYLFAFWLGALLMLLLVYGRFLRRG